MCASVLVGCVPGSGESHLLFPPEARAWCRLDGKFVARRREVNEDLSSARPRFCDTWPLFEREWGAGDTASTLECVSGDPVRFVRGGVGDYRILGITPRPGSRQFWMDVNRDVAPVSGTPYVWVDAALGAVLRRAQRAKSPSSGGDTPAFSSNSGSRVTVPPPLSRDEVKMMFEFRTRLGDSGFCSYQFLCVSPLKG